MQWRIAFLLLLSACLLSEFIWPFAERALLVLLAGEFGAAPLAKPEIQPDIIFRQHRVTPCEVAASASAATVYFL